MNPDHGEPMSVTPDPVLASRILVVDDEQYIADMLCTSLRFVGFDVRAAGSGAEALAVADDFRPELLVLDVMLPDFDGFELLRQLRAQSRPVAVVFLTARDGMEDKISGLTLGGDDYITKPFRLEELIARIGAVLRRTRGATGTPVQDGRISYADLIMDEDSHLVWRQDEQVDLSPTEFALLRYLMHNAGRVLSRAQILDHVWSYDFGGDSSVVDSYIRYLRKKVDVFSPPLIQTVRGVGYTLRVPSAKP
jgi:two-component system, OmpR family, response regulator